MHVSNERYKLQQTKHARNYERLITGLNVHFHVLVPECAIVFVGVKDQRDLHSLLLASLLSCGFHGALKRALK